jgi:hypothetical protein
VETDLFLEDMKQWMIDNPIMPDDLSDVTNKDHKSGNKNPFFGLKHSDAWKQAARERMMGNKRTAGYTYKREHVEQRAASRSRPVTIRGVTYNSGRAAAKALGVGPSTIVQWKKNGQ